MVEIKIDPHEYGVIYTARLGVCCGGGRTEGEAIDNLERAIINWNIINGNYGKGYDNRNSGECQQTPEC